MTSWVSPTRQQKCDKKFSNMVAKSSGHDRKVTVFVFQEAHLSRNVTHKRKWHDRNPNSPDLNDLSEDWTEHLENQARHKSVETPQRAVQHKRGSGRRAQHKLLPRLLTDRRSKYIQAQTDDKVAGPQEQGRQWCLLLYDGKTFWKRKHANKLPEDPNCEWHRPFHKRGEGLHPGARHSPLREAGGRFAYGLVSWTIALFFRNDVFNVGCVVDSRLTEKTGLKVTSAWLTTTCSRAPEQRLTRKKHPRVTGIPAACHPAFSLRNHFKKHSCRSAAIFA